MGQQQDGFSVCAHPVRVLNGPYHWPYDNGTSVGMQIVITVYSDSDTNFDMNNEVFDLEQVSDTYDHTGCFEGLSPMTPDTNRYVIKRSANLASIPSLLNT